MIAVAVGVAVAAVAVAEDERRMPGNVDAGHYTSRLARSSSRSGTNLQRGAEGPKLGRAPFHLEEECAQFRNMGADRHLEAAEPVTSSCDSR